MSQMIERYVIDQGDPLGMAAEIATEVTEGMLSEFPPVLIFNADGTYLAEGAVGGQWTAVDDQLTLKEGKASGSYRLHRGRRYAHSVCGPCRFLCSQTFPRHTRGPGHARVQIYQAMSTTLRRFPT